MTHAWLGCLLFGSLLLAANEDTEFNVNTRYTVENVIVSGDDWSTDVVAGSDERISSSLRKEILVLVGRKLNPQSLDGLAKRLRKELHAQAVSHRLARGANPESVLVVFDAKVKPRPFDVSVPKFLYNAKQGWSGVIEGTATHRNNSVTFGLVSDGDELAERFAGILARYENAQLGNGRLRLRFQFESYHEQWNRATLNALPPEQASEPLETSGIYRSRQNFEPVASFALAKPLTLSVGAGFQRMESQFPAAHTEAANALIMTLRYHRRLDDSEDQHDLDAGYNLRAAAKILDSGYAYTRHSLTFRYSMTRGHHVLSDALTAGAIGGRAPLFERFVLGNSTTLRGWSKYALDPLGGNRMVHNSVEYRYRFVQVFYDAGAIWDRGDAAVTRHSVGVGFRQGGFSLAVAMPVREGRAEPIFMVGMNY